jgi:aspartate oxidase
VTQRFDYIIVGSGIAGLYAALTARQHGTVCVLTKGSIDECNTKYAQGGIAAAIGADDDPELHFQDTLAAGAGLVHFRSALRISSTFASDAPIGRYSHDGFSHGAGAGNPSRSPSIRSQSTLGE